MDARDVVADLTAESDDLDALVASTAWLRVGSADTGGWLDHRTSDRPPRLDRPGRAHGDHRPGRVHGAPPGGPGGAESFVDQGAQEFLDEPRRVTGPVARRSGGARAGAARARSDREGALVRHCHVAGVDGDRPDHGDLGAWPGRRGRPRRSAGIDRSASQHRPPWPPDARLLIPGPRSGSADAARATGADGTRWDTVDISDHDDAINRVTGPALDFCLLVTQRRHRSDLALMADGSVADEWLDIAQAFAGPPGTGRQPSGAAA